MPSAERSVTINRPAADVFAYIADGTNGTEWRSAVVDVQHESGDGVGAVYRQRVRGPLRRKIKADYEVTTFDPGRKLEFKAIAGPVRPRGSYRLSESNGRTKLTFKLDAQLGRVRRLLMGRSVQKSMDAEMKALDKLKEVLEAAAPAPTAKAETSKSTTTKSTTAAKSTASKAAAAKADPPKTGSRTASRTAGAKAAPTPPRTARRRTKAS